jgi:hypothetical protein
VNSSRLLHDSILGIVEKFPAERKPLDFLARKEGDKIFIDKALPEFWTTAKGEKIPLEGFLSLHASVEAALTKQIGMSLESAREMAFRMEKVAVESQGQSWTEYKNFLKPYLDKYGVAIDLRDKRMVAATKELKSLVNVDTSFDIPATAGYAAGNPKEIFIDRGAAKVFPTSSGDRIDSVPYLTVHEVVEKALIDELRFTDRSYQRTHQIAQQLEKAAVLAAGHSWDEYQYEIMVREIDKAYNKPVRRTPPDLDLTPYRDTGDAPMIAKIRKAEVAPQSLALERDVSARVAGLFTASKLIPDVYFLKFDGTSDMAATMMRFQEFYESPKFRGKRFTRSEFRDWYRKKKGKFTYYQDWGDGFNIPSSTLEPFYKNEFPYLTDKERKLLRFFRDQKGKPFYIIATAEGSAAETFPHEIAHSLYYLNPAYRAEVEAVMRQVNTKPVKDFIYKTYGDYHKAVLDDEAHAWLMNNEEDLAHDGFDTGPYKETIEKLKAVFARYYKE